MGCSRTPRLLLTRCWAEIFLESRKRKPQVAGSRTTCVKSGDKGFDTEIEIEIEIETSHSMSTDAVFLSAM
jgi:hypothetical protein